MMMFDRNSFMFLHFLSKRNETENETTAQMATTFAEYFITMFTIVTLMYLVCDCRAEIPWSGEHSLFVGGCFFAGKIEKLIFDI